MILDLVVVYAHVLAAVFWIGQSLFWTIVIGSLQETGSSDGGRLLGLMRRSSWPPAPIPGPFRMRFRDLGWAILTVLAATGALILILRPGGDGGLTKSVAPAMTMKLVGVATLVVLQVWWWYRPRPTVAYLSMALSLVIVALSVVAH